MDWDWNKVEGLMDRARNTLKMIADDDDSVIPESTWKYIQALQAEFDQNW